MHAMADRPIAVLGLAVAALAVAVSGCGSTSSKSGSAQGSASGASQKPAVTKAQFIAQAEDVCRELNSQETPLKVRQESLKGQSAASSEKAFVSLAGQLVGFSRTAESRLKSLPRPPGEGTTIEKLVSAFDAETADVAEIAYAVAHQESSTGEAAAAALKRSIAGSSSTADELGMKDCIG
jgi:hypothetical protein